MSSSPNPSPKRPKKLVSEPKGTSNQAAIEPQSAAVPPKNLIAHQVAIEPQSFAVPPNQPVAEQVATPPLVAVPPKKTVVAEEVTKAEPVVVTPPVSKETSSKTPLTVVGIISSTETQSPSLETTEEINLRQHPIPPPSEPMQYRAIGLIRGRYTSSSEQFTQGTLLTSDGTAIDAVLLGRIMSLVKNHLNLEEEHLWVVYPRTRQQDNNLHAQIVGVWEPETLASDHSSSTETVPEKELVGSSENVTNPTVEDDYFSIRGEVIFQGQDPAHVIVKIKQAARKPAEGPKFFKLKLTGTLAGKAIGHFWEFHVRRQDNNLEIQASQDIGLLPPTKKPKGAAKGRPGVKKPWNTNRPPRKDYQSTTEAPSLAHKDPLPKPIKKVERPVKRPLNPE